MEQKKEFKITKKWFVAQHPSKAELKWFLKYVPKGKCTIPEFLKIAEENAESRKVVTFLWWLMRRLPKNPEPLVLEEYTRGNIFYNGDVHIKGRFQLQAERHVICKNLDVDGQIEIGYSSQLFADVITAINLIIEGFARVRAEAVNVQNLNITGCTILWLTYIYAERLRIDEDAQIRSIYPSSVCSTY